MRYPAALRRSSALLCATALVTAGGISTGVLVDAASAAVASTLSPNAVSNTTTGNTSFTLNGSGFVPGDSVSLVPTIVPTGSADYAKEVKPIPGTTTGTFNPNAITFTAPLSNAAPEPYDVLVTSVSGATATCPSCLLVTGGGRPTVGAVAGTNAGAFTVTGTNLARGAKVEFLKADGVTPDDGMVFSPGTDASNGTHTSGYTDSTKLNGTYTFTDAATAGRHYLRVTNTDGSQSRSNTVEFWQPKLTSVTPTKLGQGAKNVPVTGIGDGIRTGSILALQEFSNTVNDITVGTAAVAAGNQAITVATTVSNAATSSTARNVTVIGPDGGYAQKPGALTITLPPVIDSQSLAAVGQGAKVTRTITGTGFEPGIVFSTTVKGLTFTTQSVAADGTSAVVLVTAAPDATVGNVTTVHALNPDGGASDYTGDGVPAPLGTPYLIAVDAAPVITKIAPNSTTAPKTTQNIGLNGTGFDTTNGMTATLNTLNGAAVAGITVTGVNVINATNATITVTVAADAPVGPRDIVLTNKGDGGTSTCSQCFGIDGLTISPSGGANTNADQDVTLTAVTGQTFTGASRLLLSKKILSADQPDIQGTISGNPAGTLAGNFNLTNAAPGYYNVIVVKADGSQVSCTGCFHVTGVSPTVTAVTPNKGGVGAISFPITITGTKFSHGETVTIPGVTVSNVTFASPTSLSAQVTIPANATPANNLTVTVSNSDAADGGGSGSLANGYSIVAAPTVTATATNTPGGKNLGQGATGQALTVTGTGFTSGSQAVFPCNGVTGTTTLTDATHLKVTVNVASTASLGACAITVVQNDNGGRSASFSPALNVTPQPAPSLIAPASILAGTAPTVTISGQGFQSGSTIQAADVTFSNYVLNSDGSLSATATVPAGATGGPRTVTVKNPDGGQGSCACKLTISKPVSVSLTTTAINPGNPASLIIRGTAGDAVQVFAKTAPATAFSVVRQSVTIGSRGTASVAITPRRNTQLYASDAGTNSNVVMLNVRPAIALTGHVAGRAASFTGSIVPGVSGARVRLFSISNGQLTLQAETFTTSGGKFSFPSHTYSAPNRTVQFLAQTTSNANNIAGQSPRSNVRFGA